MYKIQTNITFLIFKILWCSIWIMIESASLTVTCRVFVFLDQAIHSSNITLATTAIGNLRIFPVPTGGKAILVCRRNSQWTRHALIASLNSLNIRYYSTINVWLAFVQQKQNLHNVQRTKPSHGKKNVGKKLYQYSTKFHEIKFLKR